MTRWTWALAVVALGAGCLSSEKQGPPARAEIRKLGGSTVEFIPKSGQHPYCLLYTISEKGVIRQLTMTRENRSIKCEAGKPIYNSSFRIPVEEGKVRAYLFFSDQRVNAGSVALQLYELRDRPKLLAMDFRLPGNISIEVLEFTPQEESAPVTGAVVGSAGLPDGGGEGLPESADGVHLDAAPPGNSAAPPAKEGATPPPGDDGAAAPAPADTKTAADVNP